MKATLMFQQMTYIDAYVNSISLTCSPHNANTTIGWYQRTNRPISIISKTANNRLMPIIGQLLVHLYSLLLQCIIVISTIYSQSHLSVNLFHNSANSAPTLSLNQLTHHMTHKKLHSNNFERVSLLHFALSFYRQGAKTTRKVGQMPKRPQIKTILDTVSKPQVDLFLGSESVGS